MKKVNSQSVGQIVTVTCSDSIQMTCAPSSRQHPIRSDSKSRMDEEDSSALKPDFEDSSTFCSDSGNSMDEELPSVQELKVLFYQNSVQWLIRRQSRLKISLQTVFLTVSYVRAYLEHHFDSQQHYEPICVVLSLLAAKMNEIYLPSFNTLIRLCACPVTKDQLIELEAKVLELFTFDMTIESNSYTWLKLFLKSNGDEANKNAEKLLLLAMTVPGCLQEGDKCLAQAIAYLIKPEALCDQHMMSHQERQSMKKIAGAVYKLYKQKRAPKP